MTNENWKYPNGLLVLAMQHMILPDHGAHRIALLQQEPYGPAVLLSPLYDPGAEKDMVAFLGTFSGLIKQYPLSFFQGIHVYAGRSADVAPNLRRALDGSLITSSLSVIDRRFADEGGPTNVFPDSYQARVVDSETTRRFSRALFPAAGHERYAVLNLFDGSLETPIYKSRETAREVRDRDLRNHRQVVVLAAGPFFNSSHNRSHLASDYRDERFEAPFRPDGAMS